MINPNYPKIDTLKTQYNPYQNSAMDMKLFLETVYTKLRSKVQRLQEIEKSKIRGKLPLPIIKEKFELTKTILSVLLELQNAVDITKPENMELVDILGYLGIQVSLGNIEKDSEKALMHYQNIVIIFDEFLRV